MKKKSTLGVGDALGSKKLSPVPAQARTQKVKALAQPLGTKGQRPKVDHSSLGVGDAIGDTIQANLAKKKPMKKPPVAKKLPSRNPDAPRKPARAIGSNAGLQLMPRRQQPEERGEPYRASKIEVEKNALAATPYSRQITVLGVHRLVPHEGFPIPGRGSEEPEFKGGKR